MGIPLSCPKCNTSFEARGVGLGPGVEVSLENVWETCPKCGNDVRYEDGVYRAKANGLVERIRALVRTQEEAQALVNALRRARDASPATIDETLADAGPEIPPLVREYLGASPEQWVRALDALIDLLLLWLSMSHPEWAIAGGIVRYAAKSAGAVINDPPQPGQHKGSEPHRLKKQRERAKNKARRKASRERRKRA